jgi:hypothetical protein
MGQVFLGASPGGRKVAIKAVRPRYANDPEFRRRFGSHLRCARRSSHTADSSSAGICHGWACTLWLRSASLGGSSSR